jgi:hypothetical protein
LITDELPGQCPPRRDGNRGFVQNGCIVNAAVAPVGLNDKIYRAPAYIVFMPNLSYVLTAPGKPSHSTKSRWASR